MPREPRRSTVAAASAVALLVVGVIDYATGPVMLLDSLYVVPVCAGAWWVGRRFGLGVMVAPIVGPTLAGFNVPAVMADPKLEVFPAGAVTPILSNDNWGDNAAADTTAQVAQQLFAFPLAAGSADAAFVVTLQPGTYTVVGSSATPGGTGVVLVEVYVVP